MLTQVKDFLDNLDTKDFFKYIGIAVAVIFLCESFIVYRFYSNISYYKKQIQALNIQREEIGELLEKAALIKEQKQEVNAILEADPNFKIEGYFIKVLELLGLSNKQVSTSVTTQERGEQNYNESILTAKFTDINMKELSELLNVFEQNKRIYTKSLEIQKSRKSPRTLEVQLTIATLKLRTEPTEYVE
jgi:hypothetical protein